MNDAAFIMSVFPPTENRFVMSVRIPFSCGGTLILWREPLWEAFTPHPRQAALVDWYRIPPNITIHHDAPAIHIIPSLAGLRISM